MWRCAAQRRAYWRRNNGPRHQRDRLASRVLSGGMSPHSRPDRSKHRQDGPWFHGRDRALRDEFRSGAAHHQSSADHGVRRCAHGFDRLSVGGNGANTTRETLQQALNCSGASRDDRDIGTHPDCHFRCARSDHTTTENGNLGRGPRLRRRQVKFRVRPEDAPGNAPQPEWPCARQPSTLARAEAVFPPDR